MARPVFGPSSTPTLILEVVASKDLWIWHAFFGLPGSLNDINVLHRSPLFAKLANGEAPKVNYNINGHEYTMGYYLVDGIYPSWATLVKTIPEPKGNKRTYFTKAHEAVWKDVERAFGVLQSRFAIVRGPARFWDEETLRDIMTCCIIMHNMIVEDEGSVDPEERFENGGDNVEPSHERTADFDEFIENHKNIRNNKTHFQLREDLVEHLWQHHSDQYS